jgi:hypothetical protein
MDREEKRFTLIEKICSFTEEELKLYFELLEDALPELFSSKESA